jgi:hypothetical protein
MRFTRPRVFLAAGLLAAAGTAGATVAAAGPASATPSQVVVVNCQGRGQVRPGGFDNFGCMPSQELLAGLHWTSWTSAAFGHGFLEVNNCTPTCAQGKFIKYPILTVLWRARPWPQHAGREHFSRLTWIYTGKRPPGHSRTAAQTFTLPPA